MMEEKIEEMKRDELHSLRQISRTELGKPEERGMKRIPTGIPGLDELIEGGFVPGSVILLSGEAGTGKTIFGSQFIWNALCMGENGVYITLQQTPEEIMNDVTIFGRDFKKAQEMDQCRIVYIEPHDIKRIIDTILKNVREINAKRLVIDSITLIGECADKPRDIRYNFSRLIRELKKIGVTTLLISEVKEGSEGLSKFGIEEFLVDGVILLKCGIDVVGGKPRSLIIRKMRRTNHDLNVHPFEITERGIRIVG